MSPLCLEAALPGKGRAEATKLLGIRKIGSGPRGAMVARLTLRKIGSEGVTHTSLFYCPGFKSDEEVYDGG